MTDFTWKVLVLDDDDGSAQATVQELIKFGVAAKDLGAPVEGLWGDNDLFAEVDFAFCDMHWLIGKEGDEQFIPTELTDNRAQFVREWVGAIRYWIAAKSSTKTPRAWPRHPIKEEDAGLWLSAMVKHLSPEAVVILYSKDGEIAASGPLAAIGRFPDTPFGVITKNPTKAIALDVFIRLLKKAQARWLNEPERPDIRRWFLSDVVMTSLVGLKPVAAPMPGLHNHADKVSFKAETFFPNLVQDGKFNVEASQEFLQFFGSGMPVWQEAALHALEHRLKRLLSPTAGPVSDEDLRTLASLCHECGDAGEPVRAVIQQQDNPLTKRQQWIVEALRLCTSALASREEDLIALCREHQGAVTYGESALVFQPGVETSDKTNPRLPFQYYYLRRSVDALIDNARGHKTGGSLTTRLDAHVCAQELTITWSDNSDGFESWESFKRELVRSIDRSGGYRGVPLGILFGLRYNARRIDVLIKATGKWHTLWPCGNAEVEASSVGMCFGLRWMFGYELS